MVVQLTEADSTPRNYLCPAHKNFIPQEPIHLAPVQEFDIGCLPPILTVIFYPSITCKPAVGKYYSFLVGHKLAEHLWVG